MSRGGSRSAAARGDGLSACRRGNAPLLVTAELPPDILGWADGLRRTHYPPERNRLRAHVTLFHALPPSAEGEVRRLLADLAKGAAAGGADQRDLMDLGTGTALDVRSDGMVALYEELSRARSTGLITLQDDRKLRLHITVQNKVDRPARRRRSRPNCARRWSRAASASTASASMHGTTGCGSLIAEYPFRG